MLQHFRSTMDHWDPAIIRLASQRPIILMDNSGVGKIGGEVPTTYAGWADNVIALLGALGFEKIDLLGFSMAGCVVQMVALNAPHLVHKLILAATCPSMGPKFVQGELPPFLELAGAVTPEQNEVAMAETYYYSTPEGRAAANLWDRIQERQEDRSDALGEAGTHRQIESFQLLAGPDPSNSFQRLHELKMPVFVANGDKDILMPTPNTWELFQRIENARLAIYPAAGHGVINQYAERFTGDVQGFLDVKT